MGDRRRPTSVVAKLSWRHAYLWGALRWSANLDGDSGREPHTALCHARTTGPNEHRCPLPVQRVRARHCTSPTSLDRMLGRMRTDCSRSLQSSYEGTHATMLQSRPRPHLRYLARLKFFQPRETLGIRLEYSGAHHHSKTPGTKARCAWMWISVSIVRQIPDFARGPIADPPPGQLVYQHHWEAFWSDTLSKGTWAGRNVKSLSLSTVSNTRRCCRLNFNRCQHAYGLVSVCTSPPACLHVSC